LAIVGPTRNPAVIQQADHDQRDARRRRAAWHAARLQGPDGGVEHDSDQKRAEKQQQRLGDGVEKADGQIHAGREQDHAGKVDHAHGACLSRINLSTRRLGGHRPLQVINCSHERWEGRCIGFGYPAAGAAKRCPSFGTRQPPRA
jgi:hypothetical protein